MCRTACRGRVDGIHGSYFGDLGFKFRPQDRLFHRCGFPQYLISDEGRILARPLIFILSFDAIVQTIDSFVKKKTIQLNSIQLFLR
jgi:hypothetical protein